MSNPSDRELGMDRPISRRDFLSGVALGAAGVLAGPDLLAALATVPGASAIVPELYPPALTGLRGSHEGSYEVAHALRDGSLWKRAGAPVDSGERYDLVVVGGGISGLAAAYFYRRQVGSSARILILDNHDDFGGHAKRNEFRHQDRTLLGFGGTWSIDSPAPYSAVARRLISDLGIDVERWSAAVDFELYRSLGLEPTLFFDRETFGRDLLLPDPGPVYEMEMGPATSAQRWLRFLEQAPLPERAKRDIVRLYEVSQDYLPGLSAAEKKQRLARISYADYLVQRAGVDRAALPFFQARPHGLYGVGIDAVPAQDAWGLGYPGFQGLGLDPEPGRGMNLDAIPNPAAGEYFFHFPDGNASITRRLVQTLIPAAIEAGSVEELVTARARYARLDQPGAAVRIRLSSTAVRLRHRGDPESAKELEVVYAQGGKLHSVHAGACILACWHSVIPYLCPELPAEQKEALAYGVKVPLVYTNVLLRNWTSFVALKTRSIHAPGGYHSSVSLDLPVSLGSYRCSRAPDEPMVVHLTRTPCSPGLSARMQHRLGRAELLGTTFETFEREIRGQLASILSAGGFDPAREIEAITVNRWPHGYAYQYNSLFDDFWRDGQLERQPCVLARRPWGRVAIANSDAAAYAYTDAAIDQAHRAVAELLDSPSPPEPS
ncbi:MAG TPA: NAD(P)-binding protein [Acidobacteriota bacterium]